MAIETTISNRDTRLFKINPDVFICPAWLRAVSGISHVKSVARVMPFLEIPSMAQLHGFVICESVER